jgi:hypothetical protein
MRILKKEVSDLHHDEPGTEGQATVAALASAVRAGASSEPQRTRQPG